MQTIAADLQMGMTPEQIAKESDISLPKIHEAQAFYRAHQPEIDASIRSEKEMEELGE